MYNVQKSESIEQVARCLDVCAGVIMVIAGVYIELTFGDLFSSSANVLLMGSTSAIATMQMMWRNVLIMQRGDALASL